MSLFCGILVYVFILSKSRVMDDSLGNAYVIKYMYMVHILLSFRES